MKVMAVVVVMLAGMVGRAQTFDEWFRQKSTQLKYLRQQIAALSAYSGVTEDGYRIVGRGTDSIAAVKRSDVGMFAGYFSSLGTAKPAIRNWAMERGIKDTSLVTDGSLRMRDEERIQVLMK